MITKEQAAKVLEVIDHGLVSGLGFPKPGQFCVEAAVCYALGLPHSDDPKCVAKSVRFLKITLNDSNWSSPQARAKGLRRLGVIQLGTKDTLDEVEFVKRLSVHSISVVIPRCFGNIVGLFDDITKENLLKAADRCELEKTVESAYAAAYAARAAASSASYVAYDAADAASYAANAAVRAAVDAAVDDVYAANATANATARAAARAAVYAAKAAARAGKDSDTELSWHCEEVVKILIDMNVPGVQFLDLT